MISKTVKLERRLFRRLFRYLLTCEPSVPVTQAFCEDISQWGRDLEQGADFDDFNHSWAAIFREIVWDRQLAETSPRVGAALFQVYGHFADMWLHTSDMPSRFPLGLAITALARVQPEPLIKVRHSSDAIWALILPTGESVLKLTGRVTLTCNPFNVAYAEEIFSLSYYSNDFDYDYNISELVAQVSNPVIETDLARFWKLYNNVEASTA